MGVIYGCFLGVISRGDRAVWGSNLRSYTDTQHTL